MPKKRLFSLAMVLFVIFALTLAACGPEPTATPEPTPTEEPTEEAPVEEATEEAPVEEADAEEADAEEADAEEADAEEADAEEADPEEADAEEADAEEADAEEADAEEVDAEAMDEEEDGVEVAMADGEEEEADAEAMDEEMDAEEADAEAMDEEMDAEEADAEEADAEAMDEEMDAEEADAEEADAEAMDEEMDAEEADAEEADAEAMDEEMDAEEADAEAMDDEMDAEEADAEAMDEEMDMMGPSVMLAPGEDVVVGVATGLSGEGIAPLGVDIQRGMELAIEDRPTVTVDGVEFTVVLDVQDDQCSAEGGQAIANRFVSDEAVVGVLGPMCSSACSAAAPIFDEAGYASVSASCTDPALTQSGFASFNRTVANDSFQGNVAADFIFNELGITSIATIHDGSTYGESLVNVLAADFEALGGEVVASDAVNVGDTDFRGLLEDIASAEPELLYFGGFPAEAARLAEQRADVGLEDSVFMGADGIRTSEFIDLAGDAAVGAYASSPVPPAGGGYDEFLERYEDTYGEQPPAAFHAYGYDAANVLLDAVEAVSYIDERDDLVVERELLMAEIRSTSDFVGLTGELNCDGTGECATGGIGVFIVEDGEFVSVSTVRQDGEMDAEAMDEEMDAEEADAEEMDAEEADAEAMDEEMDAEEADAEAMDEEMDAEEADAEAMDEEMDAEEADAEAMDEEMDAEEADAEAMDEEMDMMGPSVMLAPGEDVVVGVATGLSGEGIAPLGVDIQRGMELAIEDRPTVTVDGVEFTVVLDVQDDQCSAEGGQAIANRFVSDEAVVGVLGPMCSSACSAAAPIFDEAGYASVSASCTDPALTQSGFASFNRTVANDSFQGNVAADFIFNELGITSIATIHDGSTYGESLVNVLAADFEALGGEVVASDAVNVGDTDFRGLLEDIASAEPELLYFGGFPAEAARLAEQRADVGLEDSVFMGADGIRTSEFIDLAGDAAVGAYASSPVPPAGGGYDEFLERYEDTYGEQPPAAFHAYGYDAANVLLDAVEAVSYIDERDDLVVERELLMAEIRSTSDFVGLTGELNCDGTGECATGGIGVFIVEDGEFVSVSTVRQDGEMDAEEADAEAMDEEMDAEAMDEEMDAEESE